MRTLVVTGLAMIATLLVAVPFLPARGQSIAVMVEKETLALTPDGGRIVLPAGTRVDACGPGAALLLDLDIKLQRIPEPCDQPFGDGFESP